MYFFSINLESQPNGGLAENCLTTFIPNNGDSPKWYDRPCVEENDSVGDVGHKFMCECTAPYLHDPDQKENPQGNNFVQICLDLYKYVNRSELAQPKKLCTSFRQKWW